MALSKTQQALAYVAQGMKIKDAADKAEVAESTLRMAIGRKKGRAVCPCCGQIVRDGFEINREVLKA